jgi:hypothetical protein
VTNSLSPSAAFAKQQELPAPDGGVAPISRAIKHDPQDRFIKQAMLGCQ